ncbi:MAG: diadenylate cyclase [Pirellulaceae bacterium]|nr:diadenylate cyclase [Pirellulaceae bacterium]
MTVLKLSRQLILVLESASKLAIESEADAMLLLLDGSTDWGRMREIIPLDVRKVIVAADHERDLDGATESGLIPLVLDKEDSPLLERLQHALLEAVADEILENQCDVIAVYSGFEQHRLDSISLIRLDERLRRLTSRDLQKLESSVPLNSLKTVIDLAIQIGREGREGKKVGTMFVVGDTRRVLQHCKDAGFDPMRGYQRKGRDLHDARVREDIKEIAQMDGAFIVSPDAIVEKSRQIIEVLHENLTLSKGLGSRHWAGAAISQKTKAIAVVVSQSSGSVRLFQNGELVLRIEPMEQAVKWKEFNYESPPESAD